MQSPFQPNITHPPVLAPYQQALVSRFIAKTYGWMFLGLLLTGLVSFQMASSETAMKMLFENRWMFYGVMIAEFALVMGMTAMFQKLSTPAAMVGFLVYAALNGVTLSMIFLIYTMSSVAHVFFISAGMFGGLALFGSVTGKSLAGVGSFVGMGLWGLILVGLANLFIQSDALSMGLAVGGVFIFAGLTAYDAQKIKTMALQTVTADQSGDHAAKGSIFGALMLYLNFINLFLSLLRLFGERRR